MFEWLLLLLAPLVPHATPPQTDYIGVVAAEAAYASLLPRSAPTKPKVDRKDCTTCNGTGKVRTGDGLGWTECPDCEVKPGGAEMVPFNGPPAQRLQVRPLPEMPQK